MADTQYLILHVNFLYFFLLNTFLDNLKSIFDWIYFNAVFTLTLSIIWDFLWQTCHVKGKELLSCNVPWVFMVAWRHHGQFASLVGSHKAVIWFSDLYQTGAWHSSHEVKWEKNFIDFSNIFQSCSQIPFRIRLNSKAFTMYAIWHLKT